MPNSSISANRFLTLRFQFRSLFRKNKDENNLRAKCLPAKTDLFRANDCFFDTENQTVRYFQQKKTTEPDFFFLCAIPY